MNRPDPARRPRVRRLLDDLAATLRTNPRLASRTGAALRGTIPAPGLEDAYVTDTKLTALRLPPALLRRAEVLVPRIERARETGVPEVSRHQVLVRAIARGLDLLEAEHPAAPKRKSK